MTFKFATAANRRRFEERARRILAYRNKYKMTLREVGAIEGVSHVTILRILRRAEELGIK